MELVNPNLPAGPALYLLPLFQIFILVYRGFYFIWTYGRSLSYAFASLFLVKFDSYFSGSNYWDILETNVELDGFALSFAVEYLLFQSQIAFQLISWHIMFVLLFMVLIDLLYILLF